MKRFLMAFCSFLYFANAFALTDGRVAVVNHQENKGGRVLIPDVALEKVLDEDAVYKNGCTGADGVVIPGCKAFTEEQKTLMLLQFAKTVDNSVASKSKFMSGKDFVDVCKVGGIKTQAECYSRVFYPTLTKLSKVRIVDACKSKTSPGAQLHCIDAFADLNLTGPQAYGLIYKYTDKYDHFVMCHPIESKAEVVGIVKTSATSDGKDFYMPVMCTTIDNGHFYTFKFRGIDNTNDLMDTSVDNLKKGMCKLWNTKYVSMNEHVPSGCLGKCNQEILEEFGLKGRQVHVADKGDICEITQQGASEDTLKTYPGHESMTYVFKDVQTKHDNQLEDTIRRYVELVEKIDVSSFKCQYTPQLYEGWNYKDRALRCKINGIDVDFVFDDLSESGSFSRAAGAQGVQCILAGGRYAAGKDCRGITRERCESMAGTRWDPDAEVCILETVESKNLVDFAAMMAGGLVLSVVFLPAAASGAVIAISAGSSVAFDVAFAGVERLEMLAPAHRARDFAKDVQACNIPIDATSCTAEQHTCAQGVIRDNFKRLEEILMDLNDDQLAVIDEMWGNVAKCLDDGELSYATTTSDTKVWDKALKASSVTLMGLGIFFSPEKAFMKLTSRAPKLARTLSRAGKIVETTSSTLGGAKYIRIFPGKLTDDEIKHLITGFQERGMYVSSNTVGDTGERFIGVADNDIFGAWSNHPGNWLFNRGTDINILKNKASGNFESRLADVLSGNAPGYHWEASRMSESEWQQLNQYLNKQGVEIVDGIHPTTGVPSKVIQKVRTNPVNGMNMVDELFNGYNSYRGFKVSATKFDANTAAAKVDELFKNGHYAKAVPTKGVSQGEEYVIVSITEGDLAKNNFVWNGNDFIRHIDNSAFASNAARLQHKEITRLGNTPVILEEVGRDGERAIAMVSVDGRKIPFYVSTGLAGKTNIPTGEWEVFFGIGSGDWLNKTAGMANHYNSSEIEQIARALNSKLGDPRSVEYILGTVGRNYSGGRGIVGGVDNLAEIDRRTINSGFKYTPNATVQSGEQNIYYNIQDIKDYLHGKSSVNSSGGFRGTAFDDAYDFSNSYSNSSRNAFAGNNFNTSGATGKRDIGSKFNMGNATNRMFDAKDYKAGTSAATNSKDVLRKWGISENSKPEDIKKRYRELSAIFHPDKTGGSNHAMQIINAEHEILIKTGLTK